MNARGFWLVLLTLCVVGGLIAAVFTPAIAATLTLPPAGSARAMSPPQPQSHPTPMATGAVAPARPTLPGGGLTVLARDTFQRPDQSLWGNASDGRTWGGDANVSPAFAITRRAGQIAGASGPLQATLAVNSADAELLFSGSVNHFDARGGINLGGVLRWQDSRNWYKALINGSILQLLKAVNGKITVLGSTPFRAVGNTSYSVRMRVLGSNLFAKAWPGASAEPATWALMVIDTQLTTGRGGIRVLLAPGAIVRITSFLETSVPATV